MKIDTSILEIGRSHYVRIPASMVKWFEIDKKKNNTTCKIEDVDENKAELTFHRR